MLMKNVHLLKTDYTGESECNGPPVLSTTFFVHFVAQINLEREKTFFRFHIKSKKIKLEVRKHWIAWNNNELLKMILQ